MLDDLLAPGLRLVVCGTAAGKVSAERRAYYAGPGNKFWWILHHAGLTPKQLAPEAFRELLDFGIGLTDVVKQQFGNDAEIDFRRSDPVGLRHKLVEYQPLVLAFNGKKAAQTFFGRQSVELGVQDDRIGRTLLFVAPSTSGAANRSWDEGYWHALGRMVGESVV